MLGIHDLALFVVSGLLLNMMPGPDSLLIMLRSGSQGWRAGSMAALGIGTGTMVHVLAAALGLSALLSASAELFAVIKLMGRSIWSISGCPCSGRGVALQRLWMGLWRCLRSLMGASSGRGCSPMSSIPRWRSFSRFCAPVHRSRFTAKGDGIHRAGLHLQSQRHDLVPSAGVFHRVCKPQVRLPARVATWLNRVMGAVRGARYQVGGGVSR